MRNSIPLLFSAVFLLLSGCSIAYNGERLFWKATQLAAPIERDSSHATPDQFTNAINAFGAVIRNTPGTVWAARAQLAIGSLYAIEKQYPQAREAYGLVLRNYSDQKPLCLTARVAMAKTHELEQHWDEAVNVYREISEFHPWSRVGLEAPLYIAHRYEQLEKAQQAADAYRAAVSSYTTLIAQAPSPTLGLQAKGYLALAYQRLGEWSQEIHVLEELVEVPSGTNRPLALLTLGAIYQAKLGDKEKAEAAYTKLVKEFPEHPLGKVAKIRLEHLGISLSPVPPPSVPK